MVNPSLNKHTIFKHLIHEQEADCIQQSLYGKEKNIVVLTKLYKGCMLIPLVTKKKNIVVLTKLYTGSMLIPWVTNWSNPCFWRDWRMMTDLVGFLRGISVQLGYVVDERIAKYGVDLGIDVLQVLRQVCLVTPNSVLMFLPLIDLARNVNGLALFILIRGRCHGSKWKTAEKIGNQGECTGERDAR